MTNSPGNRTGLYYRIRLKEHIDHSWSDWFEGMAIRVDGDQTILSGRVEDQAALHGLLIRVRDLNLTLLSVEQLVTDKLKNDPPSDTASTGKAEGNNSKLESGGYREKD